MYVTVNDVQFYCIGRVPEEFGVTIHRANVERARA
jgi:hypothetical protein